MSSHQKKPVTPVRVTVKQVFENPRSESIPASEKSMPPTHPPGTSAFKKAWRWLWWFIWEDTSIWSWFANIILAFVLIKFLVYPALGFALGTTHPIVAVVSSSMEHDVNFDSWWTEGGYCTGGDMSQTALKSYGTYGIDKAEFLAFPFHNGFNKGDIMILSGPTKLKVGDVAVFNAGLGEPVIHRVILLTNSTLTTRGDNNCGLNGFEQDIPNSRLVGKAQLRIPLLGWIKIGFVNLMGLVTGRA